MNALNIPSPFAHLHTEKPNVLRPFSALSGGVNEFFETFLAFFPIIFIVPSKVATHVGVFNETRA